MERHNMSRRPTGIRTPAPKKLRFWGPAGVLPGSALAVEEYTLLYTVMFSACKIRDGGRTVSSQTTRQKHVIPHLYDIATRQKKLHPNMHGRKR